MSFERVSAGESPLKPLIIKVQPSSSALLAAIRNKRLGSVKALVKHGADWSQSHMEVTPLNEAATNGYYDAVSALLFTNSRICTRTKSHHEACRSALSVACGIEHVQIVSLLLRWGVPVDATDKTGCTALMIAAASGNTKLIQMLIDHGARMNAIDKMERTALHLAAAKNKAHVVRYLCEHYPACIDVTDRHGRTALCIAAENGHVHTVRELLRAGANSTMVEKNSVHRIEELLSNEAATPYVDPSNKRGMWAVPCTKIPAYLHHGALYRSLDKEDDSLVHVPFDCIRFRDQANNLCEFSILLRTMRFWILGRIPDGVIEYCLYHEYQEWRKVALNVLGSNFIEYRDLCAIFCGVTENAIFRAIRANRVEIVTYLACVATCSSQYHSIAAYAARLGKLESLQSLHACDVAWDKKTCAAAAAGGHLECLKYAHENGCEWDASTLICAALHGHFECVKYAFLSGCPGHVDLALKAAQGGNLKCIEYVTANGLSHANRWACAFAAQGGHVEVLRYLHEQGCAWDIYTTDYAARAGKLETLRYAIENGCMYSRDAVSLAAGAGSLPCLQYLVHNVGIYVSELDNVFASAVLTGNHDCFAYLLRVGYRFGNFSVLLEPTTDLEKKCMAKADFDTKFCACLSHATHYGLVIDRFVHDFVELNKLRKCEEFLRKGGVLATAEQ